MKHKLTIGWLYPDLMSTYGDRGNIICITKRCEWRDIAVEVVPIQKDTTDQEIKLIDLLFGGGAQDHDQELVMKDLKEKKADNIKEAIENDTPALFVCGAPQLMGKYYEPAEGQRIDGLGVFDMVSKHPGPNAPRLIGNIVAEVYLNNLSPTPYPLTTNPSHIVGFENHGGRTYLGKDAKPFARVVRGFGNNGEDGTEGVVYKNAIGCYFHGPLLPKNPHIADYLIAKALEVKYKTPISLTTLNDTLEWQAHQTIVKRLGVDL